MATGLCLWLVAAGWATAQRVGDAPARRVVDAPFAAVKDVRFDVPVTNGLVLYLAADAIEGIDDGDPVAQWDDLSGYGYHAAQPTAGNRPVYQTGVINGLPVVRFNGSSSFMRMDLTATGLKYPKTMFWVYRPAVTTGDRRVFGVATLVGDHAFTGIRIDATRIQAWGGGSWLSTTDADDVQANQETLMTLRFDPDRRVTGFVNGVQKLTPGTQNGWGVDFADYSIGRPYVTHGAYFQGDMAEILIYNRALPDPERLAVEQYLGKKWLDW